LLRIEFSTQNAGASPADVIRTARAFIYVRNTGMQTRSLSKECDDAKETKKRSLFIRNKSLFPFAHTPIL
jgi:hypothetical protein